MILNFGTTRKLRKELHDCKANLQMLKAFHNADAKHIRILHEQILEHKIYIIAILKQVGGRVDIPDDVKMALDTRADYVTYTYDMRTKTTILQLLSHERKECTNGGKSTNTNTNTNTNTKR